LIPIFSFFFVIKQIVEDGSIQGSPQMDLPPFFPFYVLLDGAETGRKDLSDILISFGFRPPAPPPRWTTLTVFFAKDWRVPTGLPSFSAQVLEARRPIK